MVRLVLVQPPHRDTFGYSMPPVGLLHAAGGASAAGHAVRFLDFALAVRRGDLRADTPAAADRLAAACAEAIAAEAPEAIGLGAMLSSLPMALDLARELHRRLPGVPLILGGQGPEQIEAAIIARHAAVAAVAVGEADFTLADWLGALAADGVPGNDRRATSGGLRAGPATSAVPGLVVRGDDGRPLRTPPRAQATPLDRVPPPAWELAESPAAYAAAAGQPSATFPIDLGRGCHFTCSFCSTPVFWQRSARHLSPARAVDELDRLATLPGLAAAYVTHDLFTFDRESVLAICAEKRRRSNTLPWECRTRLDLVDEELLLAMAAAGCTRILFGVESDRPGVLARVRKGGGAAALDVRAALALVERCGIASILGTMAGVPGESRADVEANLALMADSATRRGVSLSLHWFNVTPGNGQADSLEAPDTEDSRLALRPGLFADLVRGHDLPAGHVPDAQRALIAQDPEIFAAFRTFAPGHATPRELFLLTRHAHLLLEVLPRTLRALAVETGAGLFAPLVAIVEEGLAAARDGDREEPAVLTRVAAVEAAGRHVRSRGSPLLCALLAYEETLHGTLEPRLDRFVHDPRALVAAVESGTWPPEPPPPVTTLCVRREDRVNAWVVAPLVADLAAGADDAAVAAHSPGLSREELLAARRRVAQLTGGQRATDCRQ